MPKNQEIPLFVYQVLEEEYESLHGSIREKVTTRLPNPEDDNEPLVVESWRDWDFHKGHIKRPDVLAEIIGSDVTPRRRVLAKRVARHAGPTDLRMTLLKKHLRSKMGDDFLRELTDAVTRSDSAGKSGDDYDTELMQRMNAMLEEPDLFWEQPQKTKGELQFVPGKERFSYGWLSEETRGLLSLRTNGVTFGKEDVKHLNRLLLEDSFPDVFQKIADVRLSAIYTLLHEEKQAALSLSGGGIRSGTFALGLIQGLARHGLLEKFDYLSTVSGGGYIGSWLTGWIHRHPEGLAGVSRDMAFGGAEKVDPDPPPLRYLRRYSNFITPQVGLLTADTWTFAGIYLRNTLLNWLVFIPLILSVLMIPRLLLSLTLIQPESQDGKIEPAPLDVLGLGLLHVPHRYIFLGLGVLLGSWALAYVILNKPGLRATLEERRPWFRGKTGQGGFLLLCLLPLLISAFCLTTYYAWSRELHELQQTSLIRFWLFGLIFTFLGWLIALVALKRFNRARLRETQAFELVGLLLAGLIGSTFFYALSQPISFDSPILGYKNRDPTWWTTTIDWFAWRTEIYICIAVPVFLLVFLLATTIFIGITSALPAKYTFVEDEDREWWARFGAWVLISIIFWVAANVVVIFGPIALLTLPKLLGALGGISGVIALLAGRSSKTPAADGAQAQPSKLAGLMGSILPVLALVFVIFFAAALSLGTTGLFQALAFVAPWLHDKFSLFNPDWLTNVSIETVNKTALAKMSEYEYYKRLIYSGIPHYPRTQAAQLVHMNVLHHTWLWFVVALGGVLALFGLALARVINLNIFSLHGGYRNRLIRGFLGASRPEHERKPNPFTGFDPSDNLHMHELRHALLAENDFDESRLAVLLENLKDAAEAEGINNPIAKGVGKGASKGALKGAVDSVDAPRTNEATPRTRDENVHLLSRHLVRHEKFEGIKDEIEGYDSRTPVTPRLIAKLRSFFNEVIEEEMLYKEDFGREMLQGGHALIVQEQIEEEMRLKQKSMYAAPDESYKDAGKNDEELASRSLRTDYQLLLNRLVIEEAYDGAIKPCVSPPYKLMHIVNTTLNLVGGSNLAWQQRKAEPFSVSPLHSGCFRVGYRNSRDYGGHDTNGISLGTAATASGAAASSNMGYYTTSPLISLLLTLFNVRLGLWLGNPGPHGQDTYKLSAPTLSFKPVLSEAFGLTDDTNEYVYLTDGGHFENLALYEMVLRRCHFIVVSDGAQDENFRFGDLGNAVRKIRIDLGVPIDFWDVPIYPNAPPAEEGSGIYWALARIRYTCVDKGPEARDGVLLYIKPTVYGDEPRDVLEYKKSFPAFPHQSTGDQFFDEPQFESYRMLGSHIMDRICGDDYKNLDLRDLMCKAFDGMKEAKPQKLEQPFRLNTSLLKWMEEWCAKPAAKEDSPRG